GRARRVREQDARLIARAWREAAQRSRHRAGSERLLRRAGGWGSHRPVLDVERGGLRVTVGRARDGRRGRGDAGRPGGRGNRRGGYLRDLRGSELGELYVAVWPFDDLGGAAD